MQAGNTSSRTVHHGGVTNVGGGGGEAQHKDYFEIGNCQATWRRVPGFGTNKRGIDNFS